MEILDRNGMVRSVAQMRPARHAQELGDAMDLVTQRRIAQAGKDVDPAWYRVHRNLSIHVTRGALALGLAADHARSR
jgi:hypothetical protein